MLRRLAAYNPLLILAALLVPALLLSLVGTVVAQGEAAVEVPELPCAPLAAYTANLTVVRTGITGGGRRTRHEIVAAQEALRTCIDAHGLVTAAGVPADR